MKYNRTFHFPFSPGLQNDDRMVESMESLIGVPIIGTEKLDGENCGITKGGVYARSHAAFTTSPWSRAVRDLHAQIGHQIPEDLFLFGENMEGIHSIEYERLDSYFYLFGVREGTKWLSWKEVEEYAFLLDLKTAPVLFQGVVNSEKELKDIVESLAVQESALGGKREGVVFRTAAEFEDSDFPRCIMKWVRKGHVNTSEHWTKTWKRAKLINGFQAW